MSKLVKLSNYFIVDLDDISRTRYICERTEIYYKRDESFTSFDDPDQIIWNTLLKHIEE
jgi:hypothetical protein